MKISIDGGGLGAKTGERFGNFVFSENLIKALSLYDKKNQYFVYTFDNLKPKLFWMKGRVSLQELREKKDVFLALNQALPFYVPGKIISFCHGLSYYFYPQYYSKDDYRRLKNQLNEMIKRSDIIIVSSEKVKKELTIINYSVKKKTFVIPFGTPFDMLANGHPELVSGSQTRSRNKFGMTKQQYFLFVGMHHPIKNIEFIRESFREFCELREFKNYKLVIVTKNCSRKKLIGLYRNATALLTASFYESFNFPVLEALSVGCPVIGLSSAIIPELRPYVNLANNKEDFIKKMKKITNKSINLPAGRQGRLYTDFNWQSYVKNLVKLY